MFEELTVCVSTHTGLPEGQVPLVPLHCMIGNIWFVKSIGYSIIMHLKQTINFLLCNFVTYC